MGGGDAGCGCGHGWWRKAWLVERTTCAARHAAAVLLANLDYERVELVVVVEQLGLWLAGKGGEGELLQVVVARRLVDEPVARGNPAQVLVDDHHRLVERVEQDGVSCFGPNAG